MFIRCFSDKVYEVQHWPAVSRLESRIFSILSVYLEDLRFLTEDDLVEQIQIRLAETGFFQADLSYIATESFIADFLRENAGAIANFLSGLPPGEHIPVEIFLACDRDDVFTRCLEESPEFARSVQSRVYRRWLKKREREIVERLARDKRGERAEEI